MSAQADIARIRADAHELGSPQDLDPLLARIGDARFVLLGEASHGTADFYRWRAELTRRLITERAFSFLAVEGDWPDCHRVHCSVVRAEGAPNDPRQALCEFRRWPTWMWANEEVAEFVTWLSGYNAARESAAPFGFHGLDVYSLWDSLRRVLAYLDTHAPERVAAARAALVCFEPFAADPRHYAYATELVPENCRDEVVRMLAQVRADAAAAGTQGLDAAFVAEQDAEVVAGAEQYYREMVRGGPRSWNIRDTHMADTLDRLIGAYGQDAKAVVWAHNTHVGDARATDMAEAGMLNLGQLVRQRHQHDGVVVVGFGTHRGSVIAADQWGGEVRRMSVTPAREQSLEGLLHNAVPDADNLFVFDQDSPQWAHQQRDHRAIGVVYWRDGYVPTEPAARYDAFIYCDQSEALTPLHRWDAAATPG